MDWKIFFATFGGIFFAELADKTMFVGIGMTAKTGKPFSVWCGSIAAYMCVTFISVLVGVSFGKYLRPEWLRYGSGSLFVLLGILMFLGKM